MLLINADMGQVLNSMLEALPQAIENSLSTNTSTNASIKQMLQAQNKALQKCGMQYIHNHLELCDESIPLAI